MLNSLNPFSTNVPLTNKPDSCFLLAKGLKNTCGRVKKHLCRLSTYVFTENVTLPQVFFKHFASKNQLPGSYIIGTLVEDGLIREHVIMLTYLIFIFD